LFGKGFIKPLLSGFICDTNTQEGISDSCCFTYLVTHIPVKYLFQILFFFCLDLLEESAQLLEALGDVVAQSAADTAEKQIVAFLDYRHVEIVVLIEDDLLVAGGGMQFALDGRAQTILQGLREDQRIEDDAGLVLSPNLVELIEIGPGGHVCSALRISEDGGAVVRDELIPVLGYKFGGGY